MLSVHCISCLRGRSSLGWAGLGGAGGAGDHAGRSHAFPSVTPQVLTELKSDNQRLKDENGALIRVISKLSK